MFTGRTLSAKEAVAHGLVSRLVAPEALEAELAGIVATIVKAFARPLVAVQESLGS